MNATKAVDAVFTAACGLLGLMCFALAVTAALLAWKIFGGWLLLAPVAGVLLYRVGKAVGA